MSRSLPAVAQRPHAPCISPTRVSGRPTDPQLYRAEVLIEADRKVVDATALHIGVRKIELDAAQGLRINGETIKLQRRMRASR